MQQQMTKKTFREKVSTYFKILCSGFAKSPKKIIESKEELVSSPTVKKRRLTFELDRALIKLSRRNIVIQQFSSKEQLNTDLEKYIGQRLANVTIAVFQGRFTEISMKNVFYPIQFMKCPPPPSEYVSLYNQIITNTPFPLRRIEKGIQAYIVEIDVNICERIEQTLSKYHKYVDHFIFLCDGSTDSKILHELFVLYKEEYMFEIEKIMMLDKCVKNMIYVSRCGNFLNIDTGSLIEFYTEQLSKKDAYFNRYDFACLLDSLLRAKLHVEVASIIGELVVTTDDIVEFDKEFTMMMQERYTYSFLIVKKFEDYKAKKGSIEEFSNIPKFYENTPLFGLAQLSSFHNKFSQTGSVISHHQGPTVSFGRAISRHMGDWDQ